MSRARVISRLLSALLALGMSVAQACGGGSSTSIDPPSGSSAISVSLTPTVVDTSTGLQRLVNVRVTRTAYTGAVTLSVDGVPTGVSATFSRTTIPGDSTSALLLLNISSSAAAGTYSLTIRASGQSVSPTTAALTLTLRATPTAAAFTMTVQPASLTIARGVIDTATVRFTRTSLSSAIATVVTGAPPGVSASIAPSSAAGDSALLIISVSASAAAGNFTLTVTAQVSGLTTRGASFALTIPASVATPVQWAQISTGFQSTCGVTKTGAAYCWGGGIIGNGSKDGDTPVTRPVRVPGTQIWKEVQIGAGHVCGVTTGGDGYCWGDGARGLLGNGGTTDQFTPTLVAGGRKWTHIEPGTQYHTCGVATDGIAYCWGTGELLGNPSPANSNVPVAVAGGFAWTTVSAGYFGTCGVTTTSQLRCWVGILGGGTFFTGTVLEAAHLWRSTSVGQHYCGITTAGSALCMGFGQGGALGHGTFADKDAWTDVAGARTWSQISAGKSGFLSLVIGAHTCAVTTAGEGFCWGPGSSGEIGDGQFASRAAPVAVAGGRTWTQLSAGAGYTCGITTASDAYCWGDGILGVLGNGERTKQPTPVRVSDPP